MNILNGKVKSRFLPLRMSLFMACIFLLSLTVQAAPVVWTISSLNSYLKQQGTKDEQSFPISVNEGVVEKLNEILSEPAKKNWFKSGLQRMSKLEAVVDPIIAKHRMPEELKVVALIESGFQDLPPNRNTSAGVWQFIESTAKVFGLRVDSQVDERRDLSKQTDAAMRYLSGAYQQFQDWELAILSYNMGAGAVGKGIVKTGSRNAWELIQKGYEGDPKYLEKFMAAQILYKHRDLLN